MTAEGPELSHPVRVDRLGASPIRVTIAADERARSALAARFDLIAIRSLRAEVTVRRRPESRWIEVSGDVEADVVQICVVTTDPVPATVQTEMTELFDDSGEIAVDEIVLDPMADTPEPVTEDTIDVGEIVAQALGLALDPYPRAPGAEPAATAAEPGDPASSSPFAKLAAIQGRPVKKG